MGLKGFRCVWKVWDGYWSLWCLWRASDVWELIGMSRKGFKWVRGYWNWCWCHWVGMERRGWVLGSRVCGESPGLGWVGGLRVGVKEQGRIYFGTIKKFVWYFVFSLISHQSSQVITVPGSPHSPQTLIPVPDLHTLSHPYQFQDPLLIPPNPSTPILGSPYPPKPSIPISWKKSLDKWHIRVQILATTVDYIDNQ